LILLTAGSKPGCGIFGLQPIRAILGFSPIKALLLADWIGRHYHSAPEALFALELIRLDDFGVYFRFIWPSCSFFAFLATETRSKGSTVQIRSVCYNSLEF